MHLRAHLTFLFLLSLCLPPTTSLAQQAPRAVLPADGAANVNVGVLQWTSQPGAACDVYLGTTENPPLFASDVTTNTVKPVHLKLHAKYYWKVVEKKGKASVPSRVFTFTTLPIQLNPSITYTPMVDPRDDKVYWTLEIGGRTWMAQNLDHDIPGRSWYHDLSEKNRVHGLLYSGDDIVARQKEICPPGWHIPTQEEWMALIEALGGLKKAGQALKDASTMYWRSSNTPGTNASGMTMLPSGSRDSKPSFANLGKYGFAWTSTPSPKDPAFTMTIDLGFMRDAVVLSVGNPLWSYSIRCVKD